jgi:hypothetical protein
LGCNPAWADGPILDDAGSEESLALQRAHEAVSADDLGMLCIGALQLRRAYFAMCGGEAVWNLPGATAVCVPDRDDGVSLDVAEEQGDLSRVSIRVHVDLSPAAHVQLNAKDLPGKPKLQKQRRGRVSNDVLLLGNAVFKRLLTWPF